MIAPPFVKDNTTDFADAEATCEAASRPLMHCVTVKTPEQQTLLALHRMRETLVRVWTAASNQIHACLLEFDASLPIVSVAITRLPVLLDDPAHALAPPMVNQLLRLHRRTGTSQ